VASLGHLGEHGLVEQAELGNGILARGDRDSGELRLDLLDARSVQSQSMIVHR
jgi:hypothetical protein